MGDEADVAGIMGDLNGGFVVKVLERGAQHAVGLLTGIHVPNVQHPQGFVTKLPGLNYKWFVKYI